MTYDFDLDFIDDDKVAMETKNLQTGQRITIQQLGFWETYERQEDGTMRVIWRVTLEEMEGLIQEGFAGTLDHPNKEVRSFVVDLVEMVKEDCQ